MDTLGKGQESLGGSYQASNNIVPIHQVFFEETSFYNNETVSEPMSATASSNQRLNGQNSYSEESIFGSVYKVPRTPRILQSLSSIFLALLKEAHGPRIECTHQRFYHFEGKILNLTFIFIDTLVTLIVVQDILIVFQHFSSQDILIKDRTFINFRTFSPQDNI